VSSLDGTELTSLIRNLCVDMVDVCLIGRSAASLIG